MEQILTTQKIPWAPGYSVSSNGDVWSHKSGRWLTSRDDRGYRIVTLSVDGKGFTPYVHTLVCYAFHGRKPQLGYVVRHLDGDPTNNVWWNVRWGTSVENAADAKVHGTALLGTRANGARLTEADVRDIRSAYSAGGGSHSELAEVYGVSPTNIGAVVRRETWSWLDDAA